jgi:hypothetical protein
MTRRQLIHAGLGTLAAPGFEPGGSSGKGGLRAAATLKRVAGIVTEYRWYSHADVILGRILGGNSMNGVHHPPRTRLVSVWTHQVPQGRDMSRDMASRHGFRIANSIEEAMTMGAGKLAVDGVIFIGEHGEYPNNELGQKLYPRFELFNQVLDVYEKTGKVVPTFFDKHLSYSWENAKAMYDRAKKLNLPWMAGSSIPVTPRSPRLEIPLDAPLEAAAAVGYGPHDAYGFHLLEALQCMVERRKGGETGIASVEWIEGGALWQWLKGEGAWARPLLDEAARRNPFRKPVALEEEARGPVLFSLQYKDGFKAAAMIIGPSGAEWSFACRTKGASAVESTFFGPTPRTRTLPHFDGLVYCIEELILTGRPLYPVERTLLTTGALALAFESKRRKARVETPGLAEISYRVPRNVFVQTA